MLSEMQQSEDSLKAAKQELDLYSESDPQRLAAMSKQLLSNGSASSDRRIRAKVG